MVQDATQAGSSGQPPSQHSSAAAAISAVKLADASKAVTPRQGHRQKKREKGAKECSHIK
jgi:hypothetical protein